MTVRQFISCSKRRDALWMAAGFVLVLVIGDRLLDRVSLPQMHGSSNYTRWKWDLYEQSRLAPDVVFLGSSYGIFGINPALVNEEVRAATGRSISSLNLCAAGATVFGEYLLVRRIVESGRLPKLVYLGVSPRGTVEAIEPALVNSLRALGDGRDLPVAASVSPYLLREGLLTTLFASRRQWDDCRLMAERLTRGAPLDGNSRIRYDQKGWATWTGSRLPVGADPGLAGPRDAERRRPASIGAGNPSRQVLREAIRLLREAGVAVRLLEMRQRSTVAACRDPLRNPEYQALLGEVVSAMKVPVIRPPTALLTDADFFDTEHIDTNGAAKLSRWLASDVAAALQLGGNLCARQ